MKRKNPVLLLWEYTQNTIMYSERLIFSGSNPYEKMSVSVRLIPNDNLMSPPLVANTTGGAMVS